MLERMWSKENMDRLLVGVQTYSYYEKQYGGPSRRCEKIYLKILLYHTWAYT